MSARPRVAITGGAGYVGSVLVPTLVDAGYDITVLDRFWYGHDVFPASLLEGGHLHTVEGDIRDPAALKSAFSGQDAVLHLACISNDPSFELNPGLGRSINLDAFPGIVSAVREAAVKRFIYASSSSVYGVKSEAVVHEDMTCEPLTDYSLFKLQCEEYLREHGAGDAVYTIIRPATVCGFGPRLRLDLTVNILTIHALVNRRIRVFGGSQLRPNLHIKDMAAAYLTLLEAPVEKVTGQTFNVGYENRSVSDLALEVKHVLGDDELEIVTESSNDLRSYHISSERIRQSLGFEPRHTIADAVSSIVEAYRADRIVEPMSNPRYYNVKLMNQLMDGGSPLLPPGIAAETRH